MCQHVCKRLNHKWRAISERLMCPSWPKKKTQVSRTKESDLYNETSSGVFRKRRGSHDALGHSTPRSASVMWSEKKAHRRWQMTRKTESVKDKKEINSETGTAEETTTSVFTMTYCL